MAVFVDVYIEGTDETSPPAIKKAVISLARCLAIPEARAHALLNEGRVKVRSNLSPDLGAELVRLLEKAGVRALASPAQQTSPGIARREGPDRPGDAPPTPADRPRATGKPATGERHVGTGAATTPARPSEEDAITGVFETVTAPLPLPSPQPPGATPEPTPSPASEELTDPRGRPR